MYGRLFLLFAFAMMGRTTAFAQCPVNLDFEEGNFNGWQLYEGSATVAGIDLFPVGGPSLDQHVLMAAVPGNGNDPYGHFPKNCPNGSGYSLKLGNNGTGAQAEGASYTFTIPATQNQFRLTYYYAVVFQNPGHQAEEQPRMEIEVKNLTDGTTAGCSSFTFVAGALPGFETSPNNATVLYKNWAANSINLDGNAGKTIRIFFKTADCTKGGHFGYAYVDVNTQCNGTFPGASFCPDDDHVSVTAPYGYEQYKWWDAGYTTVLGTSQILQLTPPPATGTTVNVILTPFPGYGCTDTLSTALTSDLIVTADAGPDKTICTENFVQLGVPPTEGFVYQWSPSAGLNNPNVSNPVAILNTTTPYTLTVTSAGGGCLTTDHVTVFKPVDNSITLIGSNSICTGSGQTAVLQVNSAPGIQWYKDGIAIPGAVSTQYTVTQSGDYKAEVSGPGCTLFTEVKRVDIYPTPAGTFTINNSSQCYASNHFEFTSTDVAVGFQYNWDFADGHRSTDPNPVHVYDGPGNYSVHLIVTGPGGCTANSTQQAIVLPNAKPDFNITPKCIDLPVILHNTSVAPGSPVVNYSWNFGNGHLSTDFEPVYAYPAGGPFTVTLSTTTAACPVPELKTFNVVIDEPAVNTRYADKTAVINFPEKLHARSIGSSVLWDPPAKLSKDNVYDPYFKGAEPQLYTITLTTKTGCVTVDTLFVRTIKKIEIHIPTAFTPNGDGVNDLLKPLLFGFSKLNYFKIYNRSGNLLFETADEQKGWDGKFNNSRLGVQTIVWIISAVDVDGVTHQEKGTTIIMR